MTHRERELVRKAELAAMNPPDATRLLGQVAGALRGMVRGGRLEAADTVLAAMRPATARLIALALAGDFDRQRREDSGLGDLLARKEVAYHELLHQDDGLHVARQRAEVIAKGTEQKQRDRSFLRRMHSTRSEKQN